MAFTPQPKAGSDDMADFFQTVGLGIAVGISVVLGLILGWAMYFNAKKCGRSTVWGIAYIIFSPVMTLLSFLGFPGAWAFAYLPWLIIVGYLLTGANKCST